MLASGGLISKIASLDRPRICFIVEAVYPDQIGGIEIQTYAIAAGLAARGLPVTLVARRIRPESPAREQTGNLRVVRLGARGRLKGTGWRAVAPLLGFIASVLAWLVRNMGRYDAVLAQGVKVLFLPASTITWLRLRPCIVKIDSPIELWEEVSAESLRRMGLSQSAAPVRMWRAVRAALLRRVGDFVVISAEIRDALLALGVKSGRIRFIPNGTDVDRFHPVSLEQRLTLRRKLGLPEGPVLLNFTGRLSAAKGLMLLAGIWKSLVTEGRSVHLVLVGTGGTSFDNCEAELRAYVEQHGLGPTVTFTGEVDNVPEYLQASDLFVFPSEYEGFPLSLFEAMACGLPVASTRVGSAREILIEGEHGALAEPKNAEQMRSAIVWLLDHQGQWPAIAERVRRLVVEQFSLSAVIDQYAALFREVVARDRSS